MLPGARSKPKPKKQKNLPWKKFFTFREMELSDCKIKKFLYGNRTLHLSAQARKIKKPPLENFLYFRKRKRRKKFLCFPKRKLLLCFGKRKPWKFFYIFQKKLLFIYENPLGIFITVSSGVFISPLIFTIVSILLSLLLEKTWEHSYVG